MFQNPKEITCVGDLYLLKLEIVENTCLETQEAIAGRCSGGKVFLKIS